MNKENNGKRNKVLSRKMRPSYVTADFFTTEAPQKEHLSIAGLTAISSINDHCFVPMI